MKNDNVSRVKELLGKAWPEDGRGSQNSAQAENGGLALAGVSNSTINFMPQPAYVFRRRRVPTFAKILLAAMISYAAVLFYQWYERIIYWPTSMKQVLANDWMQPMTVDESGAVLLFAGEVGGTVLVGLTAAWLLWRLSNWIARIVN